MHALPAMRSGLKLAPPAPRIEVDAVSRPARMFTGDFYFTHRHGARLWFAHGDVAGKGASAAVVMAMIQEELERRIASCAEASCDPSRTIARLHDFLLPIIPGNRFATAVIGHLGDDGTLAITNGGHCPPLIARADGRVEEIASTGPLLGILKEPSWRSRTEHLEAGDALVLYSDGVIEATRDERELGVSGLKEIVSSIRLCGRELTTAAILERLESYRHDDDVTVVVVRR